MQNVLSVSDRNAFRRWLADHHDTQQECWVSLVYGRPTDPNVFYYVDAVEEALCYGWIDGTARVIDGVSYRRFSPRRPDGLWTELNKERVRRLEALGLMTQAGRRVLPPMGPRSFVPDPDVVHALKEARVYTAFGRFPALYRRVRLYNVAFYKNRDEAAYRRALAHLIDATRRGQTYGEWNDYGRLLDYKQH